MEKEKEEVEHFLVDSIAEILGESSNIRKTRIVCTLGPSVASKEKMINLLDSGMNVARLNFSHGDHAYHKQLIDHLRAALKDRPDLSCPIMLDTKGPEIRTGVLVDGKPILLVKDQELELTTDYSFMGTLQKIAISYENLPKQVSIGSKILIADGNLTLQVTEKGENFVKTKVLNGMLLGEKKNCNLPNVEVDLPVVTEKDEDDILEFGLKQGIDMIAASFMRSAVQVEEIRDLLGPRGAHIKIISKIENQQGLDNYMGILKASDGIMVARGDLGMEIPPEKVFICQKWMIHMANAYGKPVITATQMLESMVKNPRPTRAEATDVANAVLDGSDCVMLSGETAGGQFPIKAVSIMARICKEAERCIDYEALTASIRKSNPNKHDMREALISSAIRTSLDIYADLIIVLTEHGNSARIVAKYRPKVPILACSINAYTVRQMNMSRGVIGLKIPSFQGIDDLIKSCIRVAKDRGICETGHKVVAIHGTKELVPGMSNLLKILTVE